MLISIITPVFNRDKLIGKTIQSVINQTYINWEHIIVDDGSSDNTISVINRYIEKDSRIKLYNRNRGPKGAQTCRNIGINKAKGEYLLMLDSDDILEPFCLKQRILILELNEGIDWLIFSKRKIKKRNKEYLLRQFLTYKIPLQISDSLWDRNFLVKQNGFNEKLARFQDVELCIRVLLNTNVSVLISNSHRIDNICIYQPNISTGNRANVVYESLIQLLSEIESYLTISKRQNLRKYLGSYLRSWLIHYDTKELNHLSNNLITFFYKYKIVNFVIFYLSRKSLNIFNFKYLSDKKFRKLFYYSIFIFN